MSNSAPDRWGRRLIQQAHRKGLPAPANSTRSSRLAAIATKLGISATEQRAMASAFEHSNGYHAVLNP